MSAEIPTSVAVAIPSTPSSSRTSRPTVLGVWSHPSAPSVEHFTSSPSSSTTLINAIPELAPAYTFSSEHHSAPLFSTSRHQAVLYDVVDDFFGASPGRNQRRSASTTIVTPTRASRHDANASNVITLGDASELPPYTPDVELGLPSYSNAVGADRSDPVVLAKYLFKYGFLFPPFWFLGAFMLLSSLTAPEDWEPAKSAEERDLLVRAIRCEEIKWSKRCLLASFFLLATVLVVVAVVLGLRRH